MGQNKEQLNKLLDFIDELAKDKENAWFVEKLRDRYGQTTDGRIDDIYEHCIVQIAREQAEQFYKDFPIKDLVPGLTEDFIRMEIFRRRNAFDDFSLAVYQQIERITNYISQISQLNDAIYKLMGHSAYIVSKQNPDGTRNDAINDRMPSSYQIAKLLFGKDAFQKSNCYLRDQYAVDKIVCILYFVCYKCKLKSNEYNQFCDYKWLFQAVYLIRCQNHRGSESKDWQKKIISEVLQAEGYYYFKFMYALLFYVDGVVKGLLKINELYDYADKQERIDIKIDAPKVVGKIELSEKDKRR